MKKIVTSIAVALLLCALSVSAAPKAKGQKVTFKQDIVVGGTTVKSGTYYVAFDEQSNELTVSDVKTKAVLAKVQARAARRASGNLLQINTSSKSGAETLTGIAFEGGKQLYSVGAEAAGGDAEGQKSQGTNQ